MDKTSNMLGFTLWLLFDDKWVNSIWNYSFLVVGRTGKLLGSPSLKMMLTQESL